MAAFTIRPAGLAEAMCALHKAAVRALCMGAYSGEEIEAWLSDREPAGLRQAMTDGGDREDEVPPLRATRYGRDDGGG